LSASYENASNIDSGIASIDCIMVSASAIKLPISVGGSIVCMVARYKVQARISTFKYQDPERFAVAQRSFLHLCCNCGSPHFYTPLNSMHTAPFVNNYGSAVLWLFRCSMLWSRILILASDSLSEFGRSCSDISSLYNRGGGPLIPQQGNYDIPVGI